ncbi:hypothetical protein [Megamonas hypermegale]|uniref:hypothetical protein n=1 Tax=Megamonas hypermegale TaxID=158847 RepID=UPI0026EA6101|nr:hypothetical protein [Megamonas hypermegale]
MKNILIFDDETNKILTISKDKSGLKVCKSIANVLYSQDNNICTMKFKTIKAADFDALVNILENNIEK